MNKIETIKPIIDELLRFYSVRYSLSINEIDENLLSADIQGDNLSFLIGFRGETLDALQTIINQIIFRRLGEWNQVIVDINGYKKQKNEKIIEITKGYIDRVRFTQKPIEMPNMNPAERRQVHTFISEYQDIVSESTGEGLNRRVVLKLKHEPNNLEAEVVEEN